MELRHWGGVLAQPSDLSTGPARHGLAPFALMTLIPMLDPATVLEDQQRLATWRPGWRRTRAATTC